MKRRTFVASATTVGVALSAGCLSTLGIGGGPSYSNWIYAPGTVEQRDHRAAVYMDTTLLEERSSDMGALGEILEDGVDASLEGTGLDIDDTEWAAGGTGLAYSVDADPAEVRDELDDNGFDEEELDGGYTLHKKNRRGFPLSFGVKEGYVLSSGGQGFIGTGASHGADVVEAMVEAEIGETERFREDSEDFSAALDAVNPGLFVALQTRDELDDTDVEDGDFEGVVADGNRIHVPDPEGDEARLKTVHVFDDADDADLDDVEEYVEDHAADGDLDEVSVTQDGRVVTGTGRADLEDLF